MEQYEIQGRDKNGLVTYRAVLYFPPAGAGQGSHKFWFRLCLAWRVFRVLRADWLEPVVRTLERLTS